MFTQNYIKMCEKAEEIQNDHKYERFDIIYNHSKTKDFKISISLDEYYRSAIEYIEREDIGENVYMVNGYVSVWAKNIIIWLPTQEQLQEMSGLSWWKFDLMCSNIRQVLSEDPLSEIEIETKEEAGMCCILMEKWNKIWNGEKWIKEVN